MSAAPALPSAGTITMFSTPWCGYCRGLKTGLDREGIAYTEVDIERQAVLVAERHDVDLKRSFGRLVGKELTQTVALPVLAFDRSASLTT